MSLYKKILFLFVILFLSCASFAQNELLNRTDPNGKKIGYWQKIENNKIVYEGKFIHDVPVDTFKYYYPSGKIKNITIFSNNGINANSVFFDEKGGVSSTGSYIDKLKDGVWKYYTDKGQIVKIENYLKGNKNGEFLTYSPETGILINNSLYKNDKLDGKKIEFFYKGDTMTITNYTNGILNGKFKAFYSNKKISTTGEYNNDKKTGKWIYYNESEKIRKTITYKDGNPELELFYFYNNSSPNPLKLSLVAYITDNSTHVSVTLNDSKKLTFKDDYAEIVSWLSPVDCVPVNKYIIAAYNSIKGYKKLDNETISVQLVPKPDQEAIATGDYSKNIKTLFDKISVEE